MQVTPLPSDASTSHELNIHMESVFSRTEELSRGQEFNHFRAFLCEAVRSYITSQSDMQQHVPRIKKIGELATSWFANPDHTICQLLVSSLQVKCLYVQESKNECNATQLGLFTILGGFGATDLKISKPFDNGMTGKGASCTQLIHTIEKNKKYFDIKENFCKFALYGIVTASTELDGANFGGHGFTIVQYPSMQNDKIQIRYRLFQSYLNYYSLSDQIQSEKIQHQPDGSFSHDYCIDMLNKLECISQSKIWDSEIDNLHNKLFKVSLPNLLGKKLHNPIHVTFHYKIVDNESFLKRVHSLSDISDQMKSFVNLVLLSDEDYEKQLDNDFCPVIIESAVCPKDT